MTKKRERNPEEHYKSIIRAQKKQIHHLQREIARLSKKETLYDEHLDCTEDDEPKHVVQEVERTLCPKCKDELEILTIGNRKIELCQSCGHRKSRKIG